MEFEIRARVARTNRAFRPRREENLALKRERNRSVGSTMLLLVNELRNDSGMIVEGDSRGYNMQSRLCADPY